MIHCGILIIYAIKNWLYDEIVRKDDPMNSCIKHSNQLATFECSSCHQALCKFCKPISFRGNILCTTCCEKEERCFFEQAERKDSSFLRSHSFQRLMITACAVALFASGFYAVIFWPREIDIPLEDKERLQYCLSLAYDAGKGSATYDRQMKNILRLDMNFRYVLSFLRQGEQAFDAKLYQQALDNYKSVKKMLPDWDWIYILIAQCYDGLGQIDSAKEKLEQAIELNPDGIKAYCVLGKIFEEADALDNAILQYTKASFVDSKNTDVLLKLSELYLKKNSFNKAREFRDKAKKLGANTDSMDTTITKKF